ncbi:MAG TPA: MmgE/PrpD family protein [Allosphingosinicella sp.]|jgi:2-methylcitrate dehydratase PrpD
METNPIRVLARWLAEAPGNWRVEALDIAHRQFVDTVAVAVRGASEEAPQRALKAVRTWGGGGCAVIGSGERLSAPWAALVNGTAAHALDYDDNFDPARAHASAVLVPAILALAEEEGASGAACLDAYIAGLEVMGRIGLAMNPAHRQRGWHATSTLGAIGAAAACARLLGLSAQQAAHALSISTSMAGGSTAQFGTMTKPLHAGLAAKAGVMAAGLGRSGIEASMAALDGLKGINRLMGEGRDFELRSIADPLLILSHGLRVKRFPNCASAHRSMDGLLELMSEHGFGGGEVKDVTVRAAWSQFDNLMYANPQDPLQAKFSLEFPLAAILADGQCGLQHFTPQAVMRSDIRAFYPRIHRVAEEPPKGTFLTHVEVRLKDGRSVAGSTLNPVGSIAAPFTWAQHWEKFETCLAGVAAGGTIRGALAGFPEAATVNPLTASLIGPFEGE